MGVEDQLISLVTGPAEEPVTLAEQKIWSKVDDDLTEDDALLTSLIVAAREWFEIALDRQLVSATWKLSLPYFGLGGRVNLPYPPLVSVTNVKYLDTDGVLQTLATSVYDVITAATPGRIQLAYNQSWPVLSVNPEAVQITFVAGYGGASSTPAMVKNGIMMLVDQWYTNREARETVPPAVWAIAASTRAMRF